MRAIGETLKARKLLVWLRWPDCLWTVPVGSEGAGFMNADQQSFFEWLIFIGL